MDSISTQAAIGSFSDSFQQLLDNFAHHTGDSLSRAHGWELIHGWVDTYGNDLRTYQDSGGHILSNTDPLKANFLRIVVNGVPYYAPVQVPSPDPGAQEPFTETLEAAQIGAGAPGGTSLITDYAAFENLVAVDTNSLLLEHARLEAQSAHVAMVALASVFTSVDTHILATHVVRIQYNGSLYDIPCSTRFGGPLQPVRNATLSCDRPVVVIAAGAANNTDVNFTASAEGTKPFTYTYEWSITDTPNSYVVFPYDGLGVMNNVDVTITQWNPGVTASGNKTSPILHFSSVHPGSDKTRIVYIRCKIAQADGTYLYTAPLKFTARDKTGNWIIMETLAPSGGLDHATSLSLYRLRLYALRHHKDETVFYLGDTGKQLVERTKAAGYDFNQVLKHVRFLASAAPYEERYTLFFKLVTGLLSHYWPECPHPVWLRHRRETQESDRDLLGTVGGHHNAKG